MGSGRHCRWTCCEAVVRPGVCVSWTLGWKRLSPYWMRGNVVHSGTGYKFELVYFVSALSICENISFISPASSQTSINCEGEEVVCTDFGRFGTLPTCTSAADCRGRKWLFSESVNCKTDVVYSPEPSEFARLATKSGAAHRGTHSGIWGSASAQGRFCDSRRWICSEAPMDKPLDSSWDGSLPQHLNCFYSNCHSMSRGIY